MKEILSIIQSSFSSKEFQGKDKKEIKNLLKSKRVDDHKLNVLRSKVFDMVKAKESDADVIQLVNWLEEVNKVLLPKTDESEVGESRCYFSPGPECENAIISSIRRARSTVKVCVFTISDNDISEELIAAHKRGVNVRIITDDDKLNDMGSDIRLLAKAGIPIKTDETTSHMHHKFAIIDKKTLINGSFNWTKSATDRNQENILITEDPKLVTAYLREFEKLWDVFPFF